MGKIELPVEMPLFCTYHWLAGAGIVLKQNPTSDNWYFNNMIQWACSDKFLEDLTTPDITLTNGTIWDIPFLETSPINNRFITKYLLELIRSMLDQGFYVMFFEVDDFYIKGKSLYNRRHFLHDGIITGYDDSNETLTLAAYDERWVFSVFQTPQQGFLKAVEEANRLSITGSIVGVKVTSQEQKLDIEMIHKGIEDYLNSKVALMYIPKGTESIYGVMVYDYLYIYLNKLQDGTIQHKQMDRRIFRLVWEHKNCMYLRIVAIEKKLNWDNRLSQEYAPLVKKAEKLRFLYSKFNLKFSAYLLETMKTILMEMRGEEIRLLQILAKQLEVVLNAGK